MVLNCKCILYLLWKESLYKSEQLPFASISLNLSMRSLPSAFLIMGSQPSTFLIMRSQPSTFLIMGSQPSTFLIMGSQPSTFLLHYRYKQTINTFTNLIPSLKKTTHYSKNDDKINIHSTLSESWCQ